MAIKFTPGVEKKNKAGGITKTVIVDAKRKPRGAPKGSPKPPGSGRKKGTKDKALVIKATLLEAATMEVFGNLTAEEIDNISPLQVMQMCNQVAIKAGNLYLIRETAKDLAPYIHPKKAAITPDDDPEKAIIIKGGLPDPNKKPDDDDDAGH